MKNAAKMHELRRMKYLASGLLIAVTILFVVARSQGNTGAWALIAAFAEAAMIGALADWFAVVALFKHPLGLPIPHTAILPRNKARVADNLAEFVRDKFLDTSTMLAKVRAFDPAGHLAEWLRQPKNAEIVGDRLVILASESLAFIDDERVKALLVEALRRRASQADFAAAAGRLLDTLTADGRHQALLDEILRKLAAWLDNPEVQQSFAGMIVEVAGNEYPRLVNMLDLVGVNPDDLGSKAAAAIVRGIDHWLHEIGENPDHPRRHAFNQTVSDFIARLKNDPVFRQRVDAVKQEMLAHPALGEYANGLWDDFTRWLRADLAQPDSQLRRKIVTATATLGETLANQRSLRDSINDHAIEALATLGPEMRDAVARHIAATVRAWDDAGLVREVELTVGRDLQFIRLNGTMVGGLIGVLIHLATGLLGAQ